MKPFLTRLAEEKLIVADGAMGTELMKRGLKPGECPELMNITAQDIVREVETQYLNAGAEIVETNTFGASPLKLSRYGLNAKTEDINRAAVKITREVAGDRAYVAACVGPSGKILKPYGDTEPADVFESYFEQIQVVVEAGVNLIWIETMTDLNEAVIAAKAARRISKDIPVIAAMTFDKTPRGFFTIMGNTIADVAKNLKEAGANAVGSNCGNGIENMIAIAREFSLCTDLPISIRPNAGMPVLNAGQVTYPETPEFWATKMSTLLELGISILGGCCGTTPEYIEEISKTVFRNS
jgi:5-methyltetrahydrofolate--homocysteine methyltransferase